MRRTALLLASMALVVLLTALPAHASTFTVNGKQDAPDANAGDGVCATEASKCTLRAAIQEANVNNQSDTINFHSALSGTITLTLGGLEIANDTPATDDLIIQGPGANKITVSGNDASGVFSVDFASVTISGLKISNGWTFSHGSGIYNTGTLKVRNSTFSENSTGGTGGGIYNYISGTMTVSNSTISGNSASNVGGGIYNFGTMAVSNSTISGNSASNVGGGIYNDYTGYVTVTNSTISGNSASNNGGGIYNVAGHLSTDPSGYVRVTNSTISGNSASNVGGGIVNGVGGSTNPAVAMLGNTIVAANSATNGGPDAFGTLTSQGNNLIGDNTGATGFVDSDLQNIDPLLGPLQNNGGPTKTHALLPGSPAVDAANNTACPPTDQRGVTRIDGDKNGSVICDIGSFERDDFTPPTVTATTPTGKKVSLRANVTATFSEAMDEATVEASGTFTLKKKGSANALSATVTYDSATRKATLDPTRKLRSGATYIATVTPAAKDSAGNALDQNSTTAGNQPKVWFFKVKN